MTAGAKAWTLVEERCTIDGIRTRRLYTRGNGPVVLLLHGYTDSSDTWRGVLDRLARRGRAATVVDLPHHGVAENSPQHLSLADFDRFVADAIRTADRGDGVVVAGNSLGALLALRAARADVTGIVSVLALAPPGSVIAGPLRALPALGWLFSRIITVAPVPDTVIRHITSRVVVLVCGGPRTPASVRRRYATHLGRDRLRNLVAVGARALPAFLSEINWPADEIDLPVTLWWGTRDHVCPVRGADRYTSIGRTIITTDAKHCPHFDDPDFVLSLLDSHEGWAASWWNSSGAVQTQSTEADAYDGTTTQGIAAEANTTSRHPAPRQPSSAQFERARLAVSTWTRDHPTSYTRPSQRDT